MDCISGVQCEGVISCCTERRYDQCTTYIGTMLVVIHVPPPRISVYGREAVLGDLEVLEGASVSRFGAE